jgi:hypothetical protein
MQPDGDDKSARLSSQAEPTELDSAMYRRLIRGARGEARSRSRRRFAAGAIAVLVAGAASVAAAPAVASTIQHFFALTGAHCPEDSTECGDGDAQVDLSQPDLSPYIVSLYPEYLTLPPGLTRDDLIRQVQELNPPMENATTFDINIVGTYEEIVYCGWVDDWNEAEAAGRTSDVAIATSAIEGALDWHGPLTQSADGIKARQIFATAAAELDAEGMQVAAQFFHCSSATDAPPTDWFSDRFNNP